MYNGKYAYVFLACSAFRPNWHFIQPITFFDVLIRG